MSLAFSRGDIWNRGDPKCGVLASWCACVRSCGVPAFAVGTMAIPKESAVDTNSETASSYAIGSAIIRARTTALLNFSQCMSWQLILYTIPLMCIFSKQSLPRVIKFVYGLVYRDRVMFM